MSSMQMPLAPADGWRFLDSVDGPIVRFLNSFAHRSWTVDQAISLVHFNPLLKAGPVLALLWWCWFRESGDRRKAQELLVYGMIASVLAIVVARILASTLPFRERPLRNPALHFRLPYRIMPEHLLGWSSFPSDTSAFFFALATGLLFVSRRAGTVALSYVTVTVFLPRIYLGIHYPSDMIVGALIGIAIAALASAPKVRATTTRPALRWLDSDPASFYACAFLFTCLATEAFVPVFDVVHFLLTTAQALVQRWL